MHIKKSIHEFILFFSIFMMIRKFHLTTTWVGLNDLHGENQFLWDKKNFKGGYKKLCPNQPQKINHRENCVELSTPHHCLNDSQCGKDRPFICEINDEKFNVSYFGH